MWKEKIKKNCSGENVKVKEHYQNRVWLRFCCIRCGCILLCIEPSNGQMYVNRHENIHGALIGAWKYYNRCIRWCDVAIPCNNRRH